MEVLKYIPEGQENAVTAETLAALAGCDERTVRQEIKRLREQEGEMILSSSRRSGYWLPGDGDLEQVKEYANMMRSYARECKKSAEAAERWINTRLQQSCFYTRFLALCNKQSVAPSAVAKAIGLNKSSATYWKKGSVPKAKTLVKLAEYFDVPVSDLLNVDKDYIGLKAEKEKGRPGESPEAATNKNTTYSIEHCAKDVKECGYGQEI